ncbi:MAG: membrane protein insertion efficiency factor YidD [Gammaproteobacteria bacterium]|nr:membrane protein insertion efficiency factor YidD [Gammaproteobacteria bacterium]
MSQLLIVIIKGYRYCISPFIGQHCRFYPSCSEYALLSLQRFGLIKGSYLTIKRLLKCQPFHPGGVDDVPELSTNQKDLNNG